ncbi:MAG: mono/diheme cytochrome c family protein [Arenicella sp.]|jgi:mono/diheme cytochrome c family protein
MLKKISQISLLLILAISLFAFNYRAKGAYSSYSQSQLLDEDLADVSVSYALDILNDDKPIQYIMSVDKDSARMGEEMVRFGKLKDGSNSRVSKYFMCTDCHNLQLETDDPSDESPERVLEYSKKNGLPFLPASTFYGMFNKEHWYNGDYSKKYGDLVKPTRDTLFNAIQLCATQCSQGREMEDWEIRSVMHYYKSIELKISDLKFTARELGEFTTYMSTNNEKAIVLLKSKYNQINDAHFGTSAIPKIEGYSPVAENGEYIYKDGCLHCHAVGRNITNFDLDDTKLTHKFLLAKKNKYNTFSISHITRYGTYAISGRKQYMPMYSYENMSDEQMLDLMYYIETKATE